MGLWLTTSHRAPTPQLPGQGSMHFWLLHAWFCRQSVLTTHSGLQVGGLPRYPLMHEQTAWPFIDRHSLFWPQGVGLHGFVSNWAVKGNKLVFQLYFLSKYFYSCVDNSKYVRGSGVHWLNAFPDIPLGQLHMGTCEITVHSAFGAQAPGQGFRHFLCKHAWSCEQSEFKTHSGRQAAYGSPLYSGKQVHTPSEQTAFGPQGDGLHLSISSFWSYPENYCVIMRM